MKCRHEYEGTHLLWWLDGRWLRWNFAVKRGLKWGDFGARRCNQCAAWLPLGPSNDSDPRVQLEMRAAEIVAEGRVASCMDHDREWHDCERCGWLNWNDNRPELRDDIYTDAWWAGYLARCIATHNTRCSTEGRSR